MGSEKNDKQVMKHNCENHERCMEMIQAVIDGSATPEELEHFKKNKEVCQPCIDHYDLESSIKDALHSKLERKCCPESTVAKIKSSLGIATLLLATLLYFLN